jgi:hypothetical protein
MEGGTTGQVLYDSATTTEAVRQAILRQVRDYCFSRLKTRPESHRTDIFEIQTRPRKAVRRSVDEVEHALKHVI